jgi:hypothetical protein
MLEAHQRAVELPIIEPGSKFLQGALIKRGPLNLVLSELKLKMDVDYQSHLNDMKGGEIAYKFAYILTKDGLPDTVLAALTRLYHEEKPGNIFYGDVIIRESESEYALYEVEQLREG